MADRKPIDDFDIRGLFAAIDGKLAAGGKIGDLFTDSTKPEDVSRDRQDSLEIHRVNFLDYAFRDLSQTRLAELNIRNAGALFKSNYENWAKHKLRSPLVRPEERELAEFSTLQDLAAAAENEFERIARELGTSALNSAEANRLKEDAFRWEVISTIVREASEIKE